MIFILLFNKTYLLKNSLIYFLNTFYKFILKNKITTNKTSFIILLKN